MNRLSAHTLTSSESAKLLEIWLLFLCTGIALVMLGVLAISSAFVATLATLMMFGVLLVLGSVFQIMNAFWARCWRGFVLHLLLGVIYLVIGIFMIDHPVQTAAGLTLLVAAGLMVGGLLRVTLSILERFNGWAWILTSGFISFFLGISIWKQWPLAGLWVIGLFIGVEMVMSGFSWIWLSLIVRFTQRESSALHGAGPQRK